MSYPAPPGAAQLAVRLVLFVSVILCLSWGAHMVREALDLQIMPEIEQDVHRIVLLAILAYVSLLAIPFVPGAEIGIAMLTAFGAVVAPLVYSATVVAMVFAYLIGRLIPASALARLLSLLRLQRASDHIARLTPLSDEERLELLMDNAPRGLLRVGARHRYVALALLVNMPGNALIGGGGGIMMLAGMSGLFAPLPTVLAVMIAVSPIPLAVYAFGG